MTIYYKKDLLSQRSTITYRVLISAFTFLVGIPIGIQSSILELKTYAITGGINKHNSIIGKKRKRLNKMQLIAKIK